MAMGGDGPWVVTVMWSLTAIGFVFVILRIYTRVVIVKSFGVDDHVYNLAFVSRTLKYFHFANDPCDSSVFFSTRFS
jgi:hypothetical protein